MNLPYNGEFKHTGGVWDIYGDMWTQVRNQLQLFYILDFVNYTSMWGSRWHQTLMQLKDHYEAPVRDLNHRLAGDQRSRTSRYESAMASH